MQEESERTAQGLGSDHSRLRCRSTGDARVNRILYCRRSRHWSRNWEWWKWNRRCDSNDDAIIVIWILFVHLFIYLFTYLFEWKWADLNYKLTEKPIKQSETLRMTGRRRLLHCFHVIAVGVVERRYPLYYTKVYKISIVRRFIECRSTDRKKLNLAL